MHVNLVRHLARVQGAVIIVIEPGLDHKIAVVFVKGSRQPFPYCKRPANPIYQTLGRFCMMPA